MIELYSTNVTATQNMTVPWNIKAVQNGYSATLNSDGQTISLNSAGVYEVSVNSYGATTAAGSYGFQLNGAAAITRAATTVTTEAATTVSTGFTALIRVNADYASTDKATITVSYTGGAGTLDLVNIVIKKVA